MTDQTTYTVTAVLNPGSETSALLRVVSVLHGRHTVVHRLTFDSDRTQGPTVTARVSLTNAGWTTLQRSLDRIVEVLQVVGSVTQEGQRQGQPPLHRAVDQQSGRFTTGLPFPHPDIALNRTP